MVSSSLSSLEQRRVPASLASCHSFTSPADWALWCGLYVISNHYEVGTGFHWCFTNSIPQPLLGARPQPLQRHKHSTRTPLCWADYSSAHCSSCRMLLFGEPPGTLIWEVTPRQTWNRFQGLYILSCMLSYPISSTLKGPLGGPG